VQLEPDQDGKVVRREPGKPLTQIWQVPGWHRWAWISNSGEYFVSCPAQELIPLDAADSLVVASVYTRSGLKGQVKLAQVLESRAQLKRNASHWYWGRCDGFNDAETAFTITSVSGSYLVDLKSGQVQKEAPREIKKEIRKDPRKNKP
jgi:hypothetical protein